MSHCMRKPVFFLTCHSISCSLHKQNDIHGHRLSLEAVLLAPIELERGKSWSISLLVGESWKQVFSCFGSSEITLLNFTCYTWAYHIRKLQRHLTNCHRHCVVWFDCDLIMLKIPQWCFFKYNFTLVRSRRSLVKACISKTPPLKKTHHTFDVWEWFRTECNLRTWTWQASIIPDQSFVL